MDKFGIFNLLNSFLDSYKKPNQSNAENVSDGNNANNLFSALSGLLKQQPTPKPTPKPTEKSPLQKNMLGTMRAHDEFVKRVKEKTSTNNQS